MHTGDLATIDAEGYCNIVGRIKDMVIRGGENVYPREIEEFLYRQAIVPLIVLAEVCSWVAVLTTAQRGHVIENSIWGLSAALIIAGLLVIGPHQLVYLYPPMIAWCIGGAVYVAFIFFLDVPMYWSRWLADETSGRRYLSLAQGLADVSRRGTVSHRWGEWKSEVLWMSLYFTFGVWSSISLVYASIALAGRGN
jgi:acyl-CoA synthetase (AMP-forming)/AMP-acid ligase II